ncbi:hypothetical protein OFO12_06790 [Campylobacter sp. JMF_04 NA10]|uniref:hypothetical protein n=1 Tax=Campylobacter sp. JMF_04 NA10 TaxID=2983824 RepID=UPI0022E9AE1C|nr:hypothetical protein [Campylobacter sp. JMF_04 NA10]MDA3077061.1 hypothetical protein [Campylobacter sp. JMF_04 NA10]
MQDFTKEQITALASDWKNHSKNQYWVKKHLAILKHLQTLKHNLNSFDDFESDFLSNLYINFSDGNLRSDKILSFGEKFPHAEYFFMDQFFDANIGAFYYDFVFKDRIAAKKDLFPKTGATSVESVLSGEDKDVVSLYIFIENIIKNFNMATQERLQRNEFKQKIINFYDTMYRLFISIDANLASEFFDICLHNQPFVVIEFLKATMKADNFFLLEHYLGDEGSLNLGVGAGADLEQASPEKLYLLASIFTQANDELPTFLYTNESVNLLNSLYTMQIENFSDFYEASAKFMSEFEPYPAQAPYNAKPVYASLFFEYLQNYKSEEVAKNTIFFGAIGSGKTRRIRALIKDKKLSPSRFCYLSFHDSFSYSDFIDGFVGDRLVNGEFKALCKKALKDPKGEYYLIIDSIDSGNFDEIFGESIALLERRYDENDPLSIIRTKNSHFIDTLDEAEMEKFSVIVKDNKSYFAVPKNLFIICAANVNDTQISPSSAKAFRWIKCECDYGVLEDFLNDNHVANAKATVAVCHALNDFMGKEARFGNEIGHGIFMGLARYASNEQITQEGLNAFFTEVLEPIFKCGYQKIDIGMAKQISSAKDIFKF